MDLEIGMVQAAFADLVWEREPIQSGELVRLCGEKFGWKKSTTYTVLHNLSKKGIFRNQEGIVTSLISKDQFYARKAEILLEKGYRGSLPLFVAALFDERKLDEKEINELQMMIDRYRISLEKDA